MEEVDNAYGRRHEAACEARARAFAQLGHVEDYVMGAGVETGPHLWPSRRAYQHITGPGYFIIATSGLSDPWEAPGVPGFGVELLIEVASVEAASPWVFHAISSIAEGIIRPGQQFRAKLDHFGTLSNEIRGDLFPAEWRCETGRVGVLLGVTPGEIPKTFKNADGEVRIVPITILRPAEIAAIVARDQARDEIAAELAGRHRGHASLLDRPPLSLASGFHVAPYLPPVPKAEEREKPRKPWWKRW